MVTLLQFYSKVLQFIMMKGSSLEAIQKLCNQQIDKSEPFPIEQI